MARSTKALGIALVILWTVLCTVLGVIGVLSVVTTRRFSTRRVIDDEEGITRRKKVDEEPEGRRGDLRAE
jgi:hypothetical protein